MAFRSLTTAARKTLRIGLIPADGIGREVIPVSAIVKMCFFFSIVNGSTFLIARPHAEHWRHWDLTSQSLSFITCSLDSICSRGRGLPYLGRLSSKCNLDVCLLHEVNMAYLAEY